MRVTAQVKESTEKAIRAAARRLFTKKGLAATTTRDIAAAAKTAVGTLFNYFPSKEALALALAADCFTEGRDNAHSRLAARQASLNEDLFTLIAADIRALKPIRAFVAEVLETSLSPFTAQAPPQAALIRAQRLEDAAAALARHDRADAATAPVMHLYWSLYLGALSYWSNDQSPKQEDTWALLDQGVRMFTGALRRPAPAAEISR